MPITKDYTDMRPSEWDRLPVLAQRIRLLLERDGITLNQLGKALGKSPSVMKSYIEKPVDIGISALEKIADAFNVSTDYLLGRTDCPAVEADLQAACGYTGLTADACMKLHNERKFREEGKERLEILSAVLSADRKNILRDFITEIHIHRGCLFRAILSLTGVPSSKLTSDDTYKFIFDIGQQIKISRYEAIEGAANILDNYIAEQTNGLIIEFEKKHPGFTIRVGEGKFEIEQISE